MIARASFNLARETIKSIGAGLVGATASGLASLARADATAVHAMQDVAIGLAPTIFLNALMSALIPAIVMLWPDIRRFPWAGIGVAAPFGRSALVILGLAAGATIAVLGLIHLAAAAFSMVGLTAAGVLAVRILQAVLVAAVLTPLTIVILFKDTFHG